MVPEIWSATDIIFVILDFFLPFYNSTDRENQKYFEKMKKAPGDIILHICTITDNHVMYCS